MKKKIFFLFVIVITSLLFFFLSQKSNSNSSDDLTHFQTVLSSFDSLDPRFVGRMVHPQYVLELLFLPLATFDEKAQLVPLLYSDLRLNGKEIRLEFQSVPFGNQRSMDPDDVVKSYEFYAGLKPFSLLGESPFKALMENLESVSREGQTLLFSLKSPQISFPKNFFNLPILPRECFESLSFDEFWGWESGPFQLMSFVPHQEVVLEKNHTFQKTGSISESWLQKVTIHLVADPFLALSALLKQDLDLVQHVLETHHFKLLEERASETYRILDYPKLSTSYIGFSLDFPPLKNPALRRQINQAIDKQQIIQTVFQGRADEAFGLFPSWLPYAGENFSSDPEPEPLLDSIEIPLYYVDQPQNREIAQMIQTQLQQAKIQLILKGQEKSSFFSLLDRGVPPMWLGSWVGFKDPDLLNFVFQSDHKVPKGANRGAYTNAKVDYYLKRAEQEQHEEKRQKLYLKVQSFLSQDPPYVFLWHNWGQVVIRKTYQSPSFLPDGRLLYLAQIRPFEHIEAGLNEW